MNAYETCQRCLSLALSIIALSGVALSNEFFYQRGGTYYSSENMHCEWSPIWRGGRAECDSKVEFWSMGQNKTGQELGQASVGQDEQYREELLT